MVYNGPTRTHRNVLPWKGCSTKRTARHICTPESEPSTVFQTPVRHGRVSCNIGIVDVTHIEGGGLGRLSRESTGDWTGDSVRTEGSTRRTRVPHTGIESFGTQGRSGTGFGPNLVSGPSLPSYQIPSRRVGPVQTRDPL